MAYLTEKLRKFGWRGLVAVGSRLALERVYCKSHYFLFRKATESARFCKPLSVYAVAINHENALQFAPLFPYRARVFRQRLSVGLHGFFYLRDDGEPMGYHWYVVGRDYFERRYRWTFRLETAEAYLFDGYLLPAGRGSSVAAQAFAQTQAAVRRLGVEKMLSVSDRNNTASWRFQMHLGFEITGCIEVTRVFTRAVRARRVEPGPLVSPEMREMMDRLTRRRENAGGVLAGPGPVAASFMVTRSRPAKPLLPPTQSQY